MQEGLGKMKTSLKLLIVGAVGLTLWCAPLEQSAGEEGSCSNSRDVIEFRDKVLPLWAGNVTEQTEWRACARIIDPWQPEVRVCVSKFYDGQVAADYAAAQDSELSDQFCKLKKSFPSVAEDSLAFRASVTEYYVSGSSRAIRRLASEFSRLRMPLDLPNVMVMDHPTYELEVHTQYDSELRTTLVNAPTNHPVVIWIRHAVEAITAAGRDEGASQSDSNSHSREK
jgi:hypothetical protein